MTDRIRQHVPASRISIGNDAPVHPQGEYILYWMIAFRRTSWNFSLDRAMEWALELNRPLLIFEPLRAGYRWASDRLHRFVIDGMADNAQRIARLRNPGVCYYPYVEPALDADKGLLTELAHRACVVVTDDFPSFFLPRMVAAVASRLPVRLECVDSNGLLPMRATERIFTTAFSFRSFLHRELPRHLTIMPRRDPLTKVKLPPLNALPASITQRWPPAPADLLAGGAAALTRLPIDHTVAVVEQRGGATSARRLLKEFLDRRLSSYATAANDPDAAARSGLSPYLHFGHIAPHELFQNLMTRENWSLNCLGVKATGQRDGWWGVSPAAESWLDQLVTWRELGYNLAAHQDESDRYETLPTWAQATLERHARDVREHVYTLDEFAAAATHDRLWNAAQNQLVRAGHIHNYLRMLWGKKILEWTATPRDALEVMIELNNRFALDGRDPNSYSGIFWVLGRYDRPWGPERPIFGTVRYMSSTNTARKVRLARYLDHYGNHLPGASGAAK